MLLKAFREIGKISDPSDVGERLILLYPIESVKFGSVTTIVHISRYTWVLPRVQGKFCLDDGCGSGYGTSFLGRNGVHVIGIDRSSKAIGYARKRYGSSQVKFEMMNALRLKFEDNTFDAVFSSEVFEHLTYEEQLQYLTEACRVLKPGGTFYIGTPNKAANPYSTHEFNPYHGNVMEIDAFKALLERYFVNVTYFAQAILDEQGNRLRSSEALQLLLKDEVIERSRTVYLPNDTDSLWLVAACEKDNA